MLKAESLFYLVQIAHYKSMNIAAEMLQVSQPTLSIAVKKLEQELGVSLLRRSHRGVALTDEGKYVVDEAKQMLEHMNNIQNHCQKILQKPDEISLENISIHVNQGMSFSRGQALLNRLAQKTRLDSLRMEEADNDLIVSKLNTDPAAYGILICKENTGLPDHLTCRTISKSKSYLQVNSNTALVAPFLQEIALKDILKIPLVAPQKGYTFFNTLMADLRRFGQPRIVFAAPNYNIMQQLVEDDLAACFYINLFPNQTGGQNSRFIAIKQAPNFVLNLVHHKNSDPLQSSIIYGIVHSVFNGV
jgi:DNA-binding transcriptional LysR family regulator